MSSWIVPDHMKSLANQTVYNFGYDTQNKITYKFNSLGFRSDEFHNQPSLFTVGNSISFGVGIDIENTFGYIVAQHFSMPYANTSFGCYLHENNEYVSNIKRIVERNTNDIVIVQINNLARKKVGPATEIFSEPNWCISRITDYFNTVESLLNGVEHYYLYWDDTNIPVPDQIKNKLLIHNKFHLDQSINNNHSTFGLKSHRVISKIIVSKIAQSTWR